MPRKLGFSDPKENITASHILYRASAPLAGGTFRFDANITIQHRFSPSPVARLRINVDDTHSVGRELPPPLEGSRETAERVAAARNIQVARYALLGLPGILSNAAAPANVIEAVGRLDAAGLALVWEASDRLHLSARGFHRILKLARMIADLDGAGDVSRLHLAEALTYRIDTTRQLRAS